MAPHADRGPARAPLARGRPIRRGSRAARRARDARDGQDPAVRARRSRQMRARVPPLCRARRTDARLGAHRDGRRHRHRAFPADGRGARGDALEFSVLAGGARGGARDRGRQRGAAEARVERAAVRARARAGATRFGRAPGRVPGRCSSARRAAPPGSSPTAASRPYDAHGKRGRGARCRGPCRTRDQEDGPRARRQRPVSSSTASADIPAAAATAVKARMINNGQSCIAAKRFIVVASVADEFEKHFVDGVRALKVGDPMNSTTDVGPLATEQIRRDIVAQVERSVALGARVLVGGAALPGPGWFFAPTVLRDVPMNAPVAAEEVFGPVAPIFRVRDTTEAIAMANATPLGLGAAVWTRDPADAARCVDEIDAGMVFMNAMVASDPRFPFGGVKDSGYGREVGVEGLREFVNIKTVRGTIPA